MITVFADNKEIPVNKIEFSDGAITYRLDELPLTNRYISVNVDPRTPVKDIREELGTIMDCIYQTNQVEITKLILNIPYFPYARCDRLFEYGNPIMLEDFCYWLNEYVSGFDEIHTCDIHNESPARAILGDTLFVKQQLGCFRESIPFDFNEDYDYIIAPDKGAIDKAFTISDHFETNIAFAGKTRDVSTGRITGFTVPDIVLTGAKVLIPDDLGDGMGTFIGLAGALKEAGAKSVDLYCTHLIAAKGLKVLDGVIDKLYYYHIAGNYVNNEDVMNFNNKTFTK